jgi:hypothetical protein
MRLVPGGGVTKRKKNVCLARSLIWNIESVAESQCWNLNIS